MMAIVIGFDKTMQHPTTLFVMKDSEAAMKHAELFCENQGLEFNPRHMKAIAREGQRTFAWYWTYPREVEGIWEGPSKWVWFYAGIALTHIELHTSIPSEDINYLIMRMRGREAVSGKTNGTLDCTRH
jgi:hypothetical protein